MPAATIHVELIIRIRLRVNKSLIKDLSYLFKVGNIDLNSYTIVTLCTYFFTMFSGV